MKKVYLEITNICNLDCAFCHKTLRPKRQMTADEFELLTDRLQGRVETMFFHLMGEPMLHPQLPDFIRRAREKGFQPCVTTNGTLLAKRGAELAEARPHKVSISLHSAEANGAFATEEYLAACADFARQAAGQGSYVALRLWNEGGLNEGNDAILSFLKAAFPGEWVPTRSGCRIADHIFIENGKKFDWPDLTAPEQTENLFCYGLRDQLGVLVDGTVVPCCLDAEGAIPLGNLLESSLEDILSSPRAKALYEGFSRHAPTEELCRRCGYAAAMKYHK